MNKLKEIILAFFVLVLIFVFSIAKVKADNSFSLKIYPPVAYLSVKPGAGLGHQIELNNEGQFTLRVTPQLVDFHSDDQTGKVILESKSENKYINIEGDPANWGQEFTLRPGEKKVINLLIAVPSDAKYEEQHSSVLFQAEQLFYEEQAPADKSMVSGIIASNIILLTTADDENRGELIIDNLSLPRFVDSFMGIRFAAKVKNIGLNAIPVSGYFKISHWPETETEIYSLYPDMVLADSRRIVRAIREEDLKELEVLEESKEVKIAAGEDFDAQKEKFIIEKLKSDLFYKKSFLLGTYDFEIKVGDDILQKRVIALPFSLFAIFLLFPLFYFLLKWLLKKGETENKED
jgi:hypothetical protein